MLPCERSPSSPPLLSSPSDPLDDELEGGEDADFRSFSGCCGYGGCWGNWSIKAGLRARASNGLASKFVVLQIVQFQEFLGAISGAVAGGLWRGLLYFSFVARHEGEPKS